MNYIPPNRIAKTVLVRDADSYVMAVVAADSSVDLQRLRLLINVPELHLANEREFDVLFPNSEIGATPPLEGVCLISLFLWIGRLPLVLRKCSEIAATGYWFTSISCSRDCSHKSSGTFVKISCNESFVTGTPNTAALG
jgi:hypothetical protein